MLTNKLAVTEFLNMFIILFKVPRTVTRMFFFICVLVEQIKTLHLYMYFNVLCTCAIIIQIY